jgi:hypothetical protein
MLDDEATPVAHFNDTVWFRRSIHQFTFSFSLGKGWKYTHTKPLIPLPRPASIVPLALYNHLSNLP